MPQLPNISPIAVDGDTNSNSGRMPPLATEVSDRSLGITDPNSLGPLAGVGLMGGTSRSHQDSTANESLTASQQEQQYGTFDVSFVDVDSEASTSSNSKKHKKRSLLGAALAFGAHGDSRDESSPTRGSRDNSDQACCEWCQDCWTVGSILLLPLRLRTWKSLAFHAATCVFASLAALWMALCGVFWVACRLFSRWLSLGQWRMLVNSSLHFLLEIDSKLFNLVAPPNEQIVVFPFASHHRRDSIVYGVELCGYFSFLKLLCSGVPGICSVGLFGYCLQAVYQSVVANLHTMRSTAAGAQEDMQADMSVLLAVLSVYFGALLLHVLALFARHVTIFFCAEYMLYIE